MAQIYFDERVAATYGMTPNVRPEAVDPAVDFLAEWRWTAQHSSLASGPAASRCR